MPKKSRKPTLKLVTNNDMPRAEEYQDIIAIVPLEQGVFAWVVEEVPPRRPFHF